MSNPHKDLEWQIPDARASRKMGWLLAYNMDSRKREIQRWDAVAKFISDAEAVCYVLGKAKRSKVCCKALRMVYGVSTLEGWDYKHAVKVKATP